MTFEDVKEIFKESIDSSDNMNQAIENLIQSIYVKGYNDALMQTGAIDAMHEANFRGMTRNDLLAKHFPKCEADRSEE